MSADSLFASTSVDDANANRQHIVRRMKLGFREALGGVVRGRWGCDSHWGSSQRQLSSICDEVEALVSPGGGGFVGTMISEVVVADVSSCVKSSLLLLLLLL